ncbi:MAG: WbqC family protein [Clostridia bacterium]
MIVAIHQPCFLPWLGYLQRMARADLFVLLDHVQFERQNYQNRTRIRAKTGSPSPDYEARWLTVPVLQRSREERVLEKEIDHSGEGRRHWASIAGTTLHHAYRDAAYSDRFLPELKDLLSFRWGKLAELNEALLGFLRDAFAIRTPMVRSSALGVSGAKSALVLDICRAVGARTFLGGMGGSRRYLDVAAFAEAGIGVEWQDFDPPVYPQCGAAPFMPGLSSLDLLLNCGPRGRDLFAPWESPRHSSRAPSRLATQATPS